MIDEPDPYGCEVDAENRHVWLWDADWNEWHCGVCGEEV